MAKNTLSISIPEINNQELVVDIIGRTPLLVKRFDEKTQQGLEDAQQGKAVRKKDPRKPEEECDRARIRDEKGRDCIRSIWVKKGMAAMGGYFGIPRGNVEQGVYLVGDLLPITSKKPIMNTSRVRVGMGSLAKTSVAYRPEFRDWSVKGVRIGFDAAVITPEQVIALLAHAGSKNGIGEWRPQKGGDFGRFDVVPAGASKKLIEDSKRSRAATKTEEAPKKRGRKPSKDVVAEIEESLPLPKKAKKVVAAKTVRRPRAPKAEKSDADTTADMKKRFGF